MGMEGRGGVLRGDREGADERRHQLPGAGRRGWPLPSRGGHQARPEAIRLTTARSSTARSRGAAMCSRGEVFHANSACPSALSGRRTGKLSLGNQRLRNCCADRAAAGMSGFSVYPQGHVPHSWQLGAACLIAISRQRQLAARGSRRIATNSQQALKCLHERCRQRGGGAGGTTITVASPD